MKTNHKNKRKLPVSPTWLFGLIGLCLSLTVSGQSGSGVAGGHGSGENLKISYSVGQVFNKPVIGENYYISQGMQHPLIQIFALDSKAEYIEFVDVTVFPNPSSHSVNVRISDAESNVYRIQLINLQGQMLTETEPFSDRTELSLRDYSSGTYFIRVIRNMQELQLFKIIKTHE